ncbi:UbiX family flavin prenyltransferase [Halorhodospira halochloris]|uniref:UbiX family flavin prenyltransferase n=1 Tax=Halorhodospira halochloris TaxID=1052 RepID=UPI000BBA8B8F|nr:aromatic acid decarboxylase [Halorhodospira halochloris]
MRDAVTVAITGASGIAYGLRLIKCLNAQEIQTHVLISKAGRAVAELENNFRLPEQADKIHALLSQELSLHPKLVRVYDSEDWNSPLASGSSAPQRMVICPCSMGTLAAVAGSHSNNLIERGADVVLKERGQLIVVPREAPLSSMHLEHMLNLSRAGATILPASPAFYHHPSNITELLDYIVARILDHLGVEHDLSERWGSTGT